MKRPVLKSKSLTVKCIFGFKKVNLWTFDPSFYNLLHIMKSSVCLSVYIKYMYALTAL